jgi:hypothetical protein
MHQAVYFVIGAFLFALSVWAFRIIYSGSATGTSSATPGPAAGKGARNNSPALATAMVLVITVIQLYRVAQDPSRTFSWVTLGIGLIASVLAVVGLSRRRRQ